MFNFIYFWLVHEKLIPFCTGMHWSLRAQHCMLRWFPHCGTWTTPLGSTGAVGADCVCCHRTGITGDPRGRWMREFISPKFNLETELIFWNHMDLYGFCRHDWIDIDWFGRIFWHLCSTFDRMDGGDRWECLPAHIWDSSAWPLKMKENNQTHGKVFWTMQWVVMVIMICCDWWCLIDITGR